MISRLERDLIEFGLIHVIHTILEPNEQAIINEVEEETKKRGLETNFVDMLNKSVDKS